MKTFHRRLLQARETELSRDAVSQFSSLVEEIGRRIELFSQTQGLLDVTLPVVVRDKGMEPELGVCRPHELFDKRRDEFTKVSFRFVLMLQLCQSSQREID